MDDVAELEMLDFGTASQNLERLLREHPKLKRDELGSSRTHRPRCQVLVAVRVCVQVGNTEGLDLQVKVENTADEGRRPEGFLCVRRAVEIALTRLEEHSIDKGDEMRRRLEHLEELCRLALVAHRQVPRQRSVGTVKVEGDLAVEEAASEVEEELAEEA